uniref:SOSS complex subunit A homolog n=1 Tax=Globodera rostochiensis TaxID=31243 RepID=A0A914GUH6_GLORO
MVNPILTKLQSNNVNSSNGQQSHQNPSTSFPSLLLLPGRRNEHIDIMEKNYHSTAERIISLSEAEMKDFMLNNVAIRNEILDGIFCAFLIENPSAKYLKYVHVYDAGWNRMLYNANFVLIEAFSFLKPEYRRQMVKFFAETIKMNVPSVDACLSNLFRALSDGTEFCETCQFAFSVAKILNANPEWIIGLKKNSLALADAFAFMARFIADLQLVVANSSFTGVEPFKSTLISVCELLIRERFSDLAGIMGKDLLISLMRLAKLPQFQNVWKSLLHNPTSLVANISLKQLLLYMPMDKFLGSRVSVSISRKIDDLKKPIERNKFSADLAAFKNAHLSGPDGGTMRAEIIRHIWVHLKQEESNHECYEARAALLGCILRTAKVGAEQQWCKLMLFWEWFGFEPRLGHLVIEPAFSTIQNMLNYHPKLGNSLIDFLIRESQSVGKSECSHLRCVGSSEIGTSAEGTIPFNISRFVPEKTTTSLGLTKSETVDATAMQPNGKETLAEGYGQIKKPKTKNLKKNLDEAKTGNKEYSQFTRKRKRTKSREEPKGEESAELRPHSVLHAHHSPAVPSTSGAMSCDSWPPTQRGSILEGRMNESIEDGGDINRLQNLLAMVRGEFQEHLEELDKALADSLFDTEEFDIEQAECIAHCLLQIFLEGTTGCFPENDLTDHPIFTLFRVIAQSEEGAESRKSLLMILAKMRNECACVGYLFLSFLRKVESDAASRRGGGEEESRRASDTYRSLCETMELSLETVLIRDLEKCSFDNVNLFARLLHIDPHQLSGLMSEIARENIVLFSPEDILDLLQGSLKWESMEQFMLWQLVQVEAVEFDKFLDLLQTLNYAQHPEATAAILVILRNMEPDPEASVMRSLLRNLFLRQPDRDLFTVDALKLLVDYSNNISPMSDTFCKLVKNALHSNDISAPPVGQVKPGKAPRVLSVEYLLDHLDRFRRHCLEKESKGAETLLNNALLLDLFTSLKSNPKLGEIRSRFGELFTLMDILLEGKKVQEVGRHRRSGKGRGGSKLSSKSAFDLDPSDGPVVKKKRKMVDAVICGFLADNDPLMPPYFRTVRNWCRRTTSLKRGQTMPLILMDEASRDGNGAYCSDADVRSDFLPGWSVRGRRRSHRKLARLNGCIAMTVFTFVLGLFCLAALLFIPWPIIDRTFADVPPDDADLRFVEVAKICGNDGHCRTVADIIARKSNSARRAMFFDGLTDGFESEVPLIRPKNATVDDSDTRLWHVDHGTLLNEYVAAMALMPFLVGSLTVRSDGYGLSSADELADIAIVGLGGGSLDAFLHLKFPWFNITVYERDVSVVELAKQWFDISDDRTRRTVIGDGVIAISEHAGKGDHLNAIILDACDFSPYISCPAAPFITLEMLRKAKSALRPLGVFVLNVLPATQRDEERTVALLQQKLLSVFPLCARMKMGRQLNSVFACLPYAASTRDRDDLVRLWQQRKDEVGGQLRLQTLLRGSRLTIGGPSH